jgi:hypothetical protein
MAIRAGLTERRSFKDRCLWGPGNWKKVQEKSLYHHSSTYIIRVVKLKPTGVDLNVCIIRTNCTALRGHRAKNSVSSFSRECSIEPKSSAKGSCYSPRNPAQSPIAIRAGLMERRSFKDRCMWGPRTLSENVISFLQRMEPKQK